TIADSTVPQPQVLQRVQISTFAGTIGLGVTTGSASIIVVGSGSGKADGAGTTALAGRLSMNRSEGIQPLLPFSQIISCGPILPLAHCRTPLTPGIGPSTSPRRITHKSNARKTG